MACKKRMKLITKRRSFITGKNPYFARKYLSKKELIQLAEGKTFRGGEKGTLSDRRAAKAELKKRGFKRVVTSTRPRHVEREGHDYF